MAHFAYCPFPDNDVDAYVKGVMSFLKTERGAEDLSKNSRVINADDVLHVVGHGHNFETSRLDANLTGSPFITANDLVSNVSKLINTNHRLIMLDCCFAMGQYLGKMWYAGKPGKFLGQIFASGLGLHHDQIIVGGSVNASTSPNRSLAGTSVGYEIGTKFSINPSTEKLFAGKSSQVVVGTEKALVVPRLLYYVNGKGDWVNADGTVGVSPPNLW